MRLVSIITRQCCQRASSCSKSSSTIYFRQSRRATFDPRGSKCSRTFSISLREYGSRHSRALLQLRGPLRRRRRQRVWNAEGSQRTHTQARLQEVLLEWSPKLDTKTAGRRDEPDEDDYLESEDMEPVEKDVEKVIARLARDVQGIRGKIDAFYQAALLVIVILALTQVLDWLGK